MGENRFLNGQLLIAMPGMADERFHRAVVYICAHSVEGAMGIVLNHAQSITFFDLLSQLDLLNQKDTCHLPETIADFIVRNGGPVEQGRGFVLHSGDYNNESTMPISEDIYLTATVDILRAFAEGKGPASAVVALGYAGWNEGQLESEISANDWLVAPATRAILFEGTIETQYDRCLASIGVDPLRLVCQVGHS